MRFSLQTEEFKDCPPGFLYILALSMVIKEVQTNDALLSTSQYQEGKFTFLVGILVSHERLKVWLILKKRPYAKGNARLWLDVQVSEIRENVYEVSVEDAKLLIQHVRTNEI